MTRAYRQQLVGAVDVPIGFMFKPPWEELRNEKWRWAWLVSVCYIDWSKGKMYQVDDGEFYWAFSDEKPVARNEKGEFYDGVGRAGSVGSEKLGTGRPLISATKKVHIPLGIDYRQVLVERPKKADMMNEPRYTDIGLNLKSRKMVMEMADQLGFSPEEVLAIAVENLYKSVKEEVIKAEKVE